VQGDTEIRQFTVVFMIILNSCLNNTKRGNQTGVSAVHKFNIQPIPTNPCTSEMLYIIVFILTHTILQGLVLGEGPKTTKPSLYVDENKSLKVFVMKVIIHSIASPGIKQVWKCAQRITVLAHTLSYCPQIFSS
jgi:hypothetical protein